MCVLWGVTNLSGVGSNFAEEGFFGEIHDVIFCILSLHYCTAVSSGQVTLFTTGVHNQFGVLVLQPAMQTLCYSSVDCYFASAVYNKTKKKRRVTPSQSHLRVFFQK